MIREFRPVVEMNENVQLNREREGIHRCFSLVFCFCRPNTNFVAFVTGLVSHWNVLIAEQMRTSCNLLIPYVAPRSRVVFRRRRSVMAKYDLSSRRRFYHPLTSTKTYWLRSFFRVPYENGFALLTVEIERALAGGRNDVGRSFPNDWKLFGSQSEPRCTV